MTTTYRSSGWLAVLTMSAAVGLVACGGSSSPSAGPSPTVVSLAASTTASASVDEWAACDRGHGDRNQTEPIINSYGLINITVPGLGRRWCRPAGNTHDANGECSPYPVAAQSLWRAAIHVQEPQGVTSQAEQLTFVRCVRANGVAEDPFSRVHRTDFIGSDVAPNRSTVIRVNHLCNKKLGSPDWWRTGSGPSGDTGFGSTGLPSDDCPSPCAFEKSGCVTGTQVRSSDG